MTKSIKSILITKKEHEYIKGNYPDEHAQIAITPEGLYISRATGDGEILEYLNEMLNAEGPNKIR